MYCSTNNDSAKRYFDLGQKAFENREIKKAINYYSLAVQKDSLFCDAWDNLGIAVSRTGGIPESYFFKSLNINKNDLSAYINWGNYCLETSNFKRAHELFWMALLIDSKSPESFYGIAITFYGEENYEAADTAITRAIELYTKNGITIGNEVYFTQGLIYYGKGDIEASKKLLVRQYDNFSNLPQMNYYLGLCYLKGNNPDKELAQKFIKKAQSNGYAIEKEVLEQLK
jgi:tetratricopeptide (TPR) repeat protein